MNLPPSLVYCDINCWSEESIWKIPSPLGSNSLTYEDIGSIGGRGCARAEWISKLAPPKELSSYWSPRPSSIWYKGKSFPRAPMRPSTCGQSCRCSSFSSSLSRSSLDYDQQFKFHSSRRHLSAQALSKQTPFIMKAAEKKALYR